MIKAQTARFIKTELGIETTLQFTFSLLLSFFSISKTRTSQGLEALFQEGGKKSKILIQFGINPVVLVIINNLWTCFSAWRTFVKGLSTNKEHFPASSKAILALYVAVSILIRATVSILFLTPCLGLFHLKMNFSCYVLVLMWKMDVVFLILVRMRFQRSLMHHINSTCALSSVQSTTRHIFSR